MDEKPGGPDYDWLYGRPGRAAQGDPEEPDATQASRRESAADGFGDGPEPWQGSQHGPEGTRVIPTGMSSPPPPRPPDGARSSAGPSQPADGPQSFGGTYAAPPRPTTGRSGAPPVRPSTGVPPTRPAAPSVRRRRRWGPRRWWVRGILALVLAWLLFLVLVPIYAFSQISKVDAEPAGHRPPATDGTTYLMVGSDSRQGLSKAQEKDLGTGAAAGQRTDTILMLHVPSNGGPNLLLSIPRDSYVDVPGFGMQKINSAYAFGGPKLLVRTVEHATHVRVDDYIQVGFTGFVDLVDAVGGITVCPKTAIDDPKAGHLRMSPGCQEVDGHTALDYSRSRAFPNGDITRELHQREVIAAVGKKAASWQTFVLPWRYWRVNMAAAHSLTIGRNVGPIALGRFAWAMAHSGGSGTKRCVVPFSSLGTPTAVGSVVTWDRTRADALFRDIRNDDTSVIHCRAL